MAESTLAVAASPRLFELCAAHPDNDEYWSEFVRRFNPILVRSISVAWRRSGQGSWPPAEVASDLLQDVYTTIIKNDFSLLRNFRGQTTAETEAYLAHTAINQTLSYLRARAALRRTADEVSLQEILEDGLEAISPSDNPLNPRQKLTEWEFVESLRQVFTGPTHQRDILLFLLHVRDGYTAAEIARLGFCELKESSIANLLGQMKSRLRKYLSEEV